jgi:hypothetical protein
MKVNQSTNRKDIAVLKADKASAKVFKGLGTGLLKDDG